jgi:hypothetical protein
LENYRDSKQHSRPIHFYKVRTLALKADLILINVRTPRYRSLSDNIIENGLYVLREHLTRKGHKVLIEDNGNLKFYQSLSPKLLARIINFFSGKILEKVTTEQKPSLIYIIPSIGLQSLLDRIHNRRMEKYLKSLVDSILAQDIPIVGQKVWYGKSYKWARRLTELIHERNPEIIVIHGGPHPSIYQEHYVRESNADLVMFSEGENGLSQIVSFVKDARRKDLRKFEIINKIKQLNIPNTGYREGTHIVKNVIKSMDINKKPVQRHDGFFKDRLKLAVITDALGCPYNSCNFCDYNRIYASYMVKDPSLVIDEIKYFITKGVGLFSFTNSNAVFQ